MFNPIERESERDTEREREIERERKRERQREREREGERERGVNLIRMGIFRVDNITAPKGITASDPHADYRGALLYFHAHPKP